jgi:hypothetical protein
MKVAQQTVSTVEREEGGRQRSGTVDRKDDGRPGAVESAAMEHATAVRAQWRGHDAAVKRKVGAEIFVFSLAKRDMSVIVRMIVLGYSGGHRGLPTQASGRTNTLPIAFPLSNIIPDDHANLYSP